MLRWLYQKTGMISLTFLIMGIGFGLALFTPLPKSTFINLSIAAMSMGCCSAISGIFYLISRHENLNTAVNAGEGIKLINQQDTPGLTNETNNKWCFSYGLIQRACNGGVSAGQGAYDFGTKKLSAYSNFGKSTNKYNEKLKECLQQVRDFRVEDEKVIMIAKQCKQDLEAITNRLKNELGDELYVKARVGIQSSKNIMIQRSLVSGDEIMELSAQLSELLQSYPSYPSEEAINLETLTDFMVENEEHHNKVLLCSDICVTKVNEFLTTECQMSSDSNLNQSTLSV